MDAHPRRFWFLAAAVFLTGWSLRGALGDQVGYTDALYWPDYTIHAVRPGSVLDEAGFQAGDSVVSVEGIPVRELGMYSRWPRSLARGPGGSIEMVVARDGARVPGTVVYRESPPEARRFRRIARVVGMSFLWLGVVALFTVPTVHAARLGVLGLVVAAGLPGPSLGSWNGARDHIQSAADVLWVLLLLEFFLGFPWAKRVARSRVVQAALWLPWFVLVGCLGVELAYHPRFYHSFGGYLGILVQVYWALVVVAIAHTWATHPRAELSAWGMGFVLAALLVIVVPNVVAILGWIVPPGFETPGQRFFPYLLVFLPLGMLLGVRRHARATRSLLR